MGIVKRHEKNWWGNWLHKVVFIQFGSDWPDTSTFLIRRVGKAFLAPELELTS